MNDDQLKLDLGVSKHEHLFPYWRKELADWIREVYYWRHHQYTTGWSMATQGFWFARYLFMNGQMSRDTFRRYWKFNQRVQRWDKLYH